MNASKNAPKRPALPLRVQRDNQARVLEMKLRFDPEVRFQVERRLNGRGFLPNPVLGRISGW